VESVLNQYKEIEKLFRRKHIDIQKYWNDQEEWEEKDK
jgi:hypothetical protein